MAENSDTRPGEAATPVYDTPHAPFILWDHVPRAGVVYGTINITLAAHRDYDGPDGSARSDFVVTAYLRGSVQAVRNLRKALDDVLLLAEPAPDGVN